MASSYIDLPIPVVTGGGSDIAPVDNYVHVSFTNGSDGSGDGSLTSPYQTIVYAMSTITTNSVSNPITISVASGNQTEIADILLKPYVNIKGEGQPTKIDLGAFKIKPATALSSSDSINFLTDFDLASEIDWDLQALGGTTTTELKINHVNIINNSSFNGRASGLDTAWYFNSIAAGLLSFDSIISAIEFVFIYGDSRRK